MDEFFHDLGAGVFGLVLLGAFVFWWCSVPRRVVWNGNDYTAESCLVIIGLATFGPAIMVVLGLL